MKKITFNAPLNHKAYSYEPMKIEVEKVIPLYGKRFEQMRDHPLEDAPEIIENRELMYMKGNTAHCILFLDANGSDGILVEAEGADYARKSQFISNARVIIEANDITAGEQQLHQEMKKMADALQVSSARSGYCAKSDPRFVEELNRKKPKTIEKIKELWYSGNMNEQYRHYSNTRYHALNLHSYFQHGHYEIRCCNASLHAGEVRAQIVLALAISNAAMTKKYCSPSVSHSDNMRYSFRVWLLNLGLIGDEYKNCRTHLLKHLTGDIAWRHPEDGIAQRERLRQERIAAREQEQRNEPPCDERVAQPPYIQGRHTHSPHAESCLDSGHVCDDRQEVGETPDENLEAAVSDCDDFEEAEEICMTM